MKDNSQILRIKNIITNDRLEVEESFIKLFSLDLNKLLENYFSLISPPNFSINKTNEGVVININFMSSHIKYFSSLSD